MKKLKILPAVLLLSNLTLAHAESLGQKVLKNYCVKAHSSRVMFKLMSKGSKGNKAKIKGCRFDTNWIADLYQQVCKGTRVRKDINYKKIHNINFPKNILYFFDGAGDFNAKMAVRNLNPVNLTGHEGVDLGMGNANGLSALIKMMNSNQHALGRHNDEIELHYHSSSGFESKAGYNSALSCSKQMKMYLDIADKLVPEDNIKPRWFVMGYSNGGELTIDFQNKVGDYGIKIDLALSIDPIVQTIKYPFMKDNKTIGYKNKNTKRFVNVFQQTDHDSMAGFELRGKPVVGADVNLELGNITSHGFANHIYMVGSRKVFNLTDREFSKVLSKKL